MANQTPKVTSADVARVRNLVYGNRKARYTAPADAVNQTLRVEGKAPEQVHRKAQHVSPKYRNASKKERNNWYNPLAKNNNTNDLDRILEIKPMSFVSPEAQKAIEGNISYDVVKPYKPYVDTLQQQKDLQAKADSTFNEFKKHTDYNDPLNKIATLRNSGYLNQIEDVTLTNLEQSPDPTLSKLQENILNEKWSQYLRDQSVIQSGTQLIPGLSDAELERNRQQREQAVRQNQLNDNFFLNQFGSSPVSDKYAYENPDVINDRTNANGTTATAVALAPLAGVSGSVSAAAALAAMGFVSPQQVAGTIRRGFQYGADDALQAWRYGSSGFFDEDYAEKNPKIAFFGNMLGDMAVGGAVTGALGDIKNMWNYGKSRGYEPVTTTAQETSFPNPLVITNEPPMLPAPKYSLEKGILPEFEYNPDIDYAGILGVDPVFNTMIRAGLQKPNPTTQSISNALSDAISEVAPKAQEFMNSWLKKSYGISDPDVPLLGYNDAEAYFNLQQYSDKYNTALMSDILQGRNSPVLHIDFLPYDPDYPFKLTNARKSMMQYGINIPPKTIDPYSRMFFQMMRRRILSDPKFRGLDISSTDKVGMPVTTFVSRLLENPNLTSLQKWQYLYDFLHNPSKFYTQPFEDAGNYSVDSYSLAATNTGKNTVVSPAQNTSVVLLNHMGQRSSQELKDLFYSNLVNHPNPYIPVQFPSPTLQIIQQYKPFAPFASLAERMKFRGNLGFDPIFPIISIKKQGGKLIKQYF